MGTADQSIEGTQERTEQESVKELEKEREGSEDQGRPEFRAFVVVVFIKVRKDVGMGLDRKCRGRTENGVGPQGPPLPLPVKS